MFHFHYTDIKQLLITTFLQPYEENANEVTLIE